MKATSLLKGFIHLWLRNYDYRPAWIFAFCLALLSAPFVVILDRHYPWVVAVPMLLGAIVIAAMESLRCMGQSEERDLKPGNENPSFAKYPSKILLSTSLESVAAVAFGFAVLISLVSLGVSISQLNSEIWTADALTFIRPLLEIVLLVSVTLAMLLTLRSRTRYRSAEFSVLQLMEHEKALAELQQIMTKSAAQRQVFCSTFHTMAHVTRDLLMSSQPESRRLPPEQVVGTLNKYCDEIVNLFTDLYDNVIPFRASISVFTSPTTVNIIARDERSLQQGDSPDNRRGMLLAENSAYFELASSETVVFASDNLDRLAGYRNSITGWKQYYNATMVVPIRRARITSEKEFDFVGFISVDCMRKNSFIDVFCDDRGQADPSLRNLLLGFADSVYVIVKRGAKPLTADFSCKNVSFEGHDLDYLELLHEIFKSRKWISSCADSKFLNPVD